MATANVQTAIVDDTRPGPQLIEVVQAAGGDDGLGDRFQAADGKHGRAEGQSPRLTSLFRAGSHVTALGGQRLALR